MDVIESSARKLTKIDRQPSVRIAGGLTLQAWTSTEAVDRLSSTTYGKDEHPRKSLALHLLFN